MKKTPILVIASTNRPGSLTQTVASYYIDLLRGKDVQATLLSLTRLPDDFTKTALYAHKGKHKTVNELIKLITRHDKLIVVVPEYNGSFPGVFKAFIDSLPYPDDKILKNKKCALVGVSKGPQGGVMALSHLTDIFHYLGMCVYPFQPRLSNIRDTSLAALQAHPQYLEYLEQQAIGFIDF